MLSVTLVVVSLVLNALAVVEPSEPAPGNDYPVGGICNIQWNADTTGTWQNTYVQLMTGSDDAMVHLTTVAHFDGTNPANTTFTYTCPDVTLYAPVYLYQFTSDASLANTNLIQWTGRFSISRGTVAAAPNGNWGTGALVNAAAAIGPPPTVAGGSAIPDPNSPNPQAPTDTTTSDPAAATPTDTTPTDTTPPDTGANNPDTTTSDPPVGVQTSAGADHAMPGVGANTRTTRPQASAAAANSSATPTGAAVSTTVSAVSLLAAAGIAIAALL